MNTFNYQQIIQGIKKGVQQVVGSTLYDAKAVNIILLIALITIADEQSKATDFTMERVEQMLDYQKTKSKQKSDINIWYNT